MRIPLWRTQTWFLWIGMACLFMLTIAPSTIIAQANCFPNATAYLSGDMNIRAGASSNSRIVATAGAGDSFAVRQSQHGEAWCWLDVGLGWMAKTTRVASSPPPLSAPAQPQANINNCCFVDRQCDTESEWTSGYWAYQNNECPVAVQPVPQSQSAQPAPQSALQSAQQSAHQAQIDNCCYIDRQCHSETDWNRGYQAFQNNLCSAASAPGSRNLPVIEGDASFRAQVIRAFEFLQGNSPKWFDYIFAKIHKIVGVHFGPEQDAHFGGEIVGMVNSGDRVVKISIKHAQRARNDLPLLISTFVHEACHLHQFDSGRYSYWDWISPIEVEQECYQMEALALSEIAPGHRQIEVNQCQADTYPSTKSCGSRL